MILVYPPFCTPAVLPYSLARLHAFIRDNYKNVSVVDLNLEFHKIKFKELFASMDRKEFLKETKEVYSKNNRLVVNGEEPELILEMLNKIGTSKVVAFSIVYSSQAFYAYALIKRLKEMGVKTIIGGPAVNHKLISIADVHLANEVELLEHLKGEKVDCDDLQTKNVIDFSKFKKYFSPEPVIPIKTSSACYYQQCTFCTHHNKTKYFEFDLDTIEQSLKGQKKVFIIDDMIHKKRLLDIAKIMKKLKIEWMCQLRPTIDLDEETLQTCFDSGLRIVVWGVESGSDRILKLMKKGTNVKDNEKVLLDSHSVGIKNVLYTMFGFPTETKNEFLETIEFLKKNSDNIDLISTSIFGLQPGTEIYKNPEKFGIENIEEKGRTILPPKIKYTGEGLSTNDAKKLLKNHKKTLEKINKYPKEMNFFRGHMLSLI